MPDDSQHEGYVKCIDAMADAARLWLRQHPFAELRFHDFDKEVAREAGRPNDRVAVVAALTDVIDRWAANTDTRSFLQALEAASEGQATYLQAKAIVDTGMENALKRASGRLPDGDWTCSGCGKLQDGFTNLDGKPLTPGPGSLTVCGDCGAVQRVNAQGTGYEALSTQALNQLPTSIRKSLLAMRNQIVQRIAHEKSRQ